MRPQAKKKNAKRPQPVANGEANDMEPGSTGSSKRPRLAGDDKDTEDAEPATTTMPATERGCGNSRGSGRGRGRGRGSRGGHGIQALATPTTRTTRAAAANSGCPLFLPS